MAGGILQLIASGAEDVYLTGNPQITFFNVVYRRYTQFSTEYIQLPFNKMQDLSNRHATIMSCKIDRNADLLYDTYLVFDLPAIFTTSDIPFGWVEDVGTKIIDSATIYVGGQILDKQYGQWLKIRSHVFEENNKRKVYKRMVGGEDALFCTSKAISDEETLAINPKRLYIPLNFFFCNNPGLSIPLIALQYTEIRIEIEFSALTEIYRVGNPLISPKKMFGSYNLSDKNNEIKKKILSENNNTDQYSLLTDVFAKNWKTNTFLVANYVYLGDDERKKFAQSSHEYLIEGVQRKKYQGLTPGPNRRRLNLLHTVKELFWVLQSPSVDLTNDWYNFTNLEDHRSLDYIYKNLKNVNTPVFWSSYKDYLNGDETDGMNQSIISEYIEDLKINNLDVNLNFENAQYMFTDYYNIMKSAKITFDGHDRFEEQGYGFFENLQLYKYHSGRGLKGLYMYTFSLKPEEFQPSGSCNMSRISNQEIVINIFGENSYPTAKYDMYLYATGYNIFRIMGGIGQLVFAN